MYVIVEIFDSVGRLVERFRCGDENTAKSDGHNYIRLFGGAWFTTTVVWEF